MTDWKKKIKNLPVPALEFDTLEPKEPPQKTRRRVDVKKILGNPAKRRSLVCSTLITTQAREGITTTPAQAAAAYDKVLRERRE